MAADTSAPPPGSPADTLSVDSLDRLLRPAVPVVTVVPLPIPAKGLTLEPGTPVGLRWSILGANNVAVDHNGEHLGTVSLAALAGRVRLLGANEVGAAIEGRPAQ